MTSQEMDSVIGCGLSGLLVAAGLAGSATLAFAVVAGLAVRLAVIGWGR